MRSSCPHGADLLSARFFAARLFFFPILFCLFPAPPHCLFPRPAFSACFFRRLIFSRRSPLFAFLARRPAPHRKPQLSQSEKRPPGLLFLRARCTIEAGKACAKRIGFADVFAQRKEGTCPRAYAANRREDRPRARKGKRPCARCKTARLSSAGCGPRATEMGETKWNKIRPAAPCLQGGSSGG